MSRFAEGKTVQDPFICYAKEAGWTYLSREEALRLRRGEDCPILWEVAVKQLQLLNPGVIDSPTKAEEVIRRLISVRPNIEGNMEAWEYLKGLKTIFVEAEKRERSIRLLDPQNPKVNTFHVTDEFSFRSGVYTIRLDIVFLINGIPILFVEAKAPTHLEGIAEALDQVRRYHQEGPELMAIAQIFALTHLVRFYYGATWNLSGKGLFNWREEQAGDFETLVKTFVAPQRVLRTLVDYILFVRKDGELSKVILRPHQMRATERVLARCLDSQKRRGLIWHTQGSGKTYTMLTVAKRLLEDPRFENPTVLMIVDRNELQQQLFQNIEAVGLSRVHVAESKQHLRDLLRQDTRGLIVSMIHKFDKADTNLNTRENIFVLVDEAHRSTGGDLGNYLMGALPNATFIGFTGTPIDRTAHGQSTFQTFGIDDQPHGYLDKYSIRESIEDGTTVPLHYQLAPNDLLPDRETMEREFWRVVELEGVADVEDLNRVLDRAVTLKEMLKNPTRVKKVAQFVAEHFKRYVEPMGYNAFLVAVDREACCLYKAALDKYLPPNYSEVVISPFYNDPPEMKRYHLTEEEEQSIRKAFKKPDQLPKILIVTEKLLTGYDAPILYCMYLDKPMRDHVLLQAIARVNRPYESEGQHKTAGLIVDFVGVFENLERALAFDSQDIIGIVEGLDVLKERFEELMKRGRLEYLPLLKGECDADKVAEAILEHFRDREKRETFYANIRELQEVYEILSPDPFLRPYLEDYTNLVEMYRLLRSAYDPHLPLDKSFLRKTAEIVRQHTTTTEVREPTATYEVGPAKLMELLRQDKPETVKVFNLLKALYDLVRERGGQQPHLIPIGERAEAIKRRFEERQIESQEALKELGKLVEDLAKAEEFRRRSNLSEEAFAIGWWLYLQGIQWERAESIAQMMQGLLQKYPYWQQNGRQEREIRREMYKALMQVQAEPSKAVGWMEQMFNLLRRREG